MRARRGLIPPRFLVLLLPLILVSCSSGGGDAPAPQAVPPVVVPPPTPASLIWSTSSGIFRSQTDGSDRLTLTDAPDLREVVPDIMESVILYRTVDSAIIDPNMRNVLWKVQVNGSGTQALANIFELSSIIDTIGSWVIYGIGLASQRIHSVALDGSVIIHSLGPPVRTFYMRSVGGRAVFLDWLDTANGMVFSNLYSELPDGTDLRHLTALPTNPDGQLTSPSTPGSVGNQVIYSVMLSDSVQDLFAVPVTGGPVTTLANSPDYESFGAVVDSRVIYHRCAVDAALHVGQCDLYSVQSDGTGTVVLSTNPDNEIVQGVIGSQVIVRRNSGATDSLYSIPASGGAEVPMLTLADPMHEFVEGIVGTRVMLKRPTGLWSLTAEGSGLVQLTTEADDHTGAAGAFACFARGPALWCVPADGSGPATQVADPGTFVTGL